jgi:hypothetical protein
MRHRNLLLGVFLLLAAGIATNPGAAAAARQAGVDVSRARIGRCHMDVCSWFIISGRHLIRRDTAGILYRLTVRGGESAHRGGHYPSNARGVRIAWDRARRELFVFCSSRLPTIISREGSGLQADVLSFPPFGYQESGASIYVALCHPGANWESRSFARRFGYSLRADPPDIHIDRPEEIFRYAR